MDGKRFSQSYTRRRALRFLTGAALASGIAGSRHAETEARKRKKRCRPGRVVSRHSIQDLNVEYITPVLAKGQLYQVRVAGYVELGSVDPNGPYGPSLTALDAEYVFDVFHPNAYNDKDTETTAGTDYGLSLEGKEPNWGPYQSDRHIYQRTIKGRGRALSLLLQAHRRASAFKSTMVVEISCA